MDQQAQTEGYAKEIDKLGSLPEPSEHGVVKSCIFQKGPLCRKEVFLDHDGMLRLITRLSNAEFIPVEQSHPLVLPSKHRLTQLLIRDYHEQVNHQGGKATFSKMASRYYVSPSAVGHVR